MDTHSHVGADSSDKAGNIPHIGSWTQSRAMKTVGGPALLMTDLKVSPSRENGEKKNEAFILYVSFKSRQQIEREKKKNLMLNLF